MDAQILEQTKYLRLNDVLALIPISKSTWWAGIKEGRFPRPVKLSKRISAWRVEDIRDLLEQYNTQVEG